MARKSQTIAIVGLGLMGASLGKALRKRVKSAHVVGLSRQQSSLRTAKKKRIIHSGTTVPKTAFRQADLIVISTPVSKLKKFIKLADQFSKPATIVTDVGSTKGEIVEWAAKQSFKNIEFVGSHPICGSPKSGIDAVMDDLYKGKFTFVTPHKKNSKKAIAQTKKLWRSVGSKVIDCTAAEHDRGTAISSHFPHLLAFAIAHQTESLRKNEGIFIGSGLRGITKMAQSNADVWIDIIASNTENIIKENKRMVRELTKLGKLLEKGDAASLRKYIKTANKIRSEF